jgi:hypothetical protein
MKKYISILSLAVVLILQSCDRSEFVSTPETQISSSGKKTQEKYSPLSNNEDEVGNSQMNKEETGEDDEPRKDKSHWRIPNDTID